MTDGSFGYGSAAHLAGELFKMLAKVDISHVPYKGSARAWNELAAGQIDRMFDVMVTAMAQVEGGTLCALAVTSLDRSNLAPSPPTMVEAGVKSFEAGTWFGLLARTGTSPEIITKLSDALDAALARPELRATLAAQGAEVAGGSPERFAAFFAAEFERWGPIVRAAGLKAE